MNADVVRSLSKSPKMHKCLLILALSIVFTPLAYSGDANGTTWLEKNTQLGLSAHAFQLENYFSSSNLIAADIISPSFFMERVSLQFGTVAHKTLSPRWSLQTGLAMQVRSFVYRYWDGQFSAGIFGYMALFQADLLPIYYFTRQGRKVRPYIGAGLSTGRDMARHMAPLRRWQAHADCVAGILLELKRFSCAVELKRSLGLTSVFENEWMRTRADLGGIGIKMMRNAS